MKDFQQPKAASFVTKVFLSFILVVTLSIGVLSVSLYASFKNIVLYYIFQAEKNSISQITYSTSVMTDMAATYAMQMYSDPHLFGLLRKNSLNVQEQYQGMKQLAAFRNSSSSRFFHSIYIYNGNMNKFFIASPNMFYQQTYESGSFYDEEIERILKNFSDYDGIIPISRRIKEPGYSGTGTEYVNVYTFIFTDLLKSNQTINSALVVNISEKWIKDTIANMDTTSGYKTVIVDKHGISVSGSKDISFLDDLSGEEYVRHILESEQESGYFVDSVNGEESLIIYSSCSGPEWHFVRIIPYSKIIMRVDRARYNTIWISSSILLAGLVCCFLFSNRLRKPIDSVVNRLNALEQEKQGNQFTLMQEFLKKLVMDPSAFGEDQITERLKSFGVDWDPFAPHIAVLVKLDSYMNFCDRHNLSERLEIKKAIMDMAGEVIPEGCPYAAIDMGDDKLLLLVNSDNAGNACVIVRNLQKIAEQRLKLSVSATVGSNSLKHPEESHSEYDRLLYLSNYRLYFGHGCILESEKLSREETQEYIFPKKKEEKLIQSLNQGKIDEAMQTYHEIVQETQRGSYTFFNMALVHLAFSIITTISDIERYGGSFSSFQASSFIARLDQLETMEEVNEHFHGLFQQIINKLDNKKQTKSDNLYRKIEQLLSREYANPCLSMTSVSDELNLSPVYFGRLFKKMFAKPFVNYVNELRMAKARELLRTTDISNEQIAEMVGYTNVSYYYKVFKKMFGVTPTEYKTSESGGKLA